MIFAGFLRTLHARSLIGTSALAARALLAVAERAKRPLNDGKQCLMQGSKMRASQGWHAVRGLREPMKPLNDSKHCPQQKNKMAAPQGHALLKRPTCFLFPAGFV